ncbi:inner membrane protein YiaA [Chitinibacteraceae bacterium HSL-7]
MSAPQKSSSAFVMASWLALVAGSASYLIGLLNAASMQLNEKGYYFTVLMFALFTAISLQKTVRDKLEGIPVNRLYYGICWAALAMAISLLCIGLVNATLTMSEKGFYGMSFGLSLFAAIAVQKNTRDNQESESLPPTF